MWGVGRYGALLRATEAAPTTAPFCLWVSPFGADDAARVRFVRRAQAMGLTLDDIGELLRVEPLRTVEQCRRVAARLGARVAAVEERIAELKAFRKALLSGLRQCERALARDECCPVVIDLAADGKDPR